MTQNSENIGRALGKIPSGVGVLTSKAGDQESAMLASWFQQVAFEPPLISVAVNQERPIATLIRTSKVFTLSLFNDQHKDLFAHFAKGFAPGDNPFQGIAIQRSKTGCAILSQSMSYLDCELSSETKAGDHLIYIGKVIDGGVLEEGTSMVHLRKSGFRY